MKKLLLILLFSTQLLHSQETSLRLEGTFDIASGESTRYATFALSGSLSYHFRLVKGLSVGPLAGYRYSFGPVDDGDIAGLHPAFIPVAVSVDTRPFSSAQWISFGGDVGQALSLDDSFEDGLFYRPRLGFSWYRGAQFVVTYTIIEPSAEISFNSFNYGWVFNLN